VGVDLAAGPLRLGAALRNALQLDAAEAPRRVAVGAGYAAEHVLIELDGSWGVQNDTAKLPTGVAATSGQVYRMGAGYQFGEEGLQVRGGYAFDQAELGHAARHLASTGLGWHTTKVAIDASFAINVAAPEEFLLAVGLTFIVPYDLP
jgi:predicted porin